MPYMTTSGACVLKAGANVNIAFTGTSAQANWDQLIHQAESLLHVATRWNISGAFGSLSGDVVDILDETASNLAAIYAIQYDMSGYTTRTEAEDMINVLRDGALRGISLLRDKKQQDFAEAQEA